MSVSLDVPSGLAAGGSFKLSWTAAQRFPLKVPVYIVVAAPGEVRFAAPPLPIKPKPADADLDVQEPPDLPGFIALPANARGPLGLDFGHGASRALIPLHQPGSKLSGSFTVRVFDAGLVPVEARVVAKTSCGETALSPNFARTLTVLPGTPEIVVQDPFDIDQPRQILIDNTGRYRAHIFDGRYRVFDIATGAKLIDRAGHEPNFSPTSRFFVATIGDKGSWSYEVIDLVSREVVATPSGQFIGWVHGDAYLIVGQGSWGALAVWPTLISRFVPKTNDSRDPTNRAADNDLRLEHPGSCHACRSWADDNMMLDLDNGVVAFTGKFDSAAQPIYELASGASICCKAPDQLRSAIAQNYEVVPFTMQKGWHAREPIAFSEVAETLNDPEPDAQAKQLGRLLVSHKRLDPKTAPVVVAQVARSAVGATIVRGDWRANAKRGDAEPQPLTTLARINSELKKLGLAVEPPLNREQIAFNNSWQSNDRSKQYAEGATEADNKRIDAMIGQRTAALERRLVGEIRALAPHLGRQRSKEATLPDPLPLQGLAKGKLYLDDTLEALWRWQIDGRPLWLLQLWATEGNGGVGEGMMFLFSGDAPGTPKSGGRIFDLTKPLETFWSGQYGSSDHQSQLIPQLYLNRYLVMASVSGQSIAVYDLTASRVLAVFKDVPQADLLATVQLSADARHVVQVNSDGQFFIHEIAGGRVVLSGRSVDDEIIIYNPQGYYASSYEGAHFVQLRFPGLPGLYPFQQFASILERPEVIKAALKGGTAPTAPGLVPPPVLNLSASNASGVGDQLSLRIHAQSSAPLARIGFYADGLLVGQREVSGTEFVGDVTLKRPINARWLTAQVTDARGLVSTPQALRLDPVARPTNTLHAVLVGINAYDNPKYTLKFARQDAERLGGALESTGGHYYGRANVVRLLDQDAKKDLILGALVQAVASAGPQDTIVFSFAGHGIADANGQYYLTTVGFDNGETQRTGLAWTEIATLLHKAKARVIVILDACHAGLSGSEGLGTNDDAIGALLSGAHPPMLVLAAAKGRQSSYEAAKWGGGVFTYALVQALQLNRAVYDLDRDGVIEASELYRALKTIVVRETKGQQTPWLVRQDLLGDFAVF